MDSSCKNVFATTVSWPYYPVVCDKPGLMKRLTCARRDMAGDLPPRNRAGLWIRAGDVFSFSNPLLPFLSAKSEKWDSGLGNRRRRDRHQRKKGVLPRRRHTRSWQGIRCRRRAVSTARPTLAAPTSRRSIRAAASIACRPSQTIGLTATKRPTTVPGSTAIPRDEGRPVTSRMPRPRRSRAQ